MSLFENQAGEDCLKFLIKLHFVICFYGPPLVLTTLLLIPPIVLHADHPGDSSHRLKTNGLSFPQDEDIDERTQGLQNPLLINRASSSLTFGDVNVILDRLNLMAIKL